MRIGQAGQDCKDTGVTVAYMAKDFPGCNLAGADLGKAELIGARLAGADLHEANLNAMAGTCVRRI